MAKPEILIDPGYQGFHNLNPGTKGRIEKSKSYQDLSTICIVPCIKTIPSKIVQNWLGMMTPMNQKFTRIFAHNMEVGQAYSDTIDAILSNPELAKWKYILTLEHDNSVPPDGLLKLYESIEEYDAVGGLYFTKGEMGQPMAYGNPAANPITNFVPFFPPAEAVTRCYGLGMGFTLFKLSMFKDKKLPRPLFQTVQRYTPGQGVQAYTQDLKFFEEAGKLGYKFAIDSRVKVGHYDVETDRYW